MNILCRLLGHRPPQDGWHKGWGGYEYCDLIGAGEDGIGRKHVLILGECPRCELRYTVGKAHLPKTPTGADHDGQR